LDKDKIKNTFTVFYNYALK